MPLGEVVQGSGQCNTGSVAKHLVPVGVKGLCVGGWGVLRAP